MPRITEIPVEIYLDNLLPFLPVQDLSRLGSTNRFFYLLSSDETFWKRKIEEDFNFSVSDTARTTGWKFLYKSLSNPKIYVWGTHDKRRLGIHPSKLPRTVVGGGIPFPVRLRIPGARIVNLVAGGMSFHAIDHRGRLYVWGALDGTGFALQSDGFSESCKIADRPLRLELPCAIHTISCARLYSAALDTDSYVWTFMSWGRPFRLISPLVDKSSPESTPLQVECGWGFTSILTQSGNVLVFWPQSGRIFDHLQVINSQFDQEGIETKAKISADHPEVIPCHVWDLQGFDPVILPPIPENLPEIPHTGLSVEQQDKPTKLIKISGMDNNIIGLTNKGHVLRFNGLHNENSYSRGRWEYLPHFSEVAKVKEDPTFSREAEPTLEPPSTMLITHISAHFKTFVAYSTGPQSVVLIGNINTGNLVHPPNEELKPTMIPYLQYQSVISVVIGDYHYGALTSAGKLLTWGAFSNGALGLGDPTKIEDGQPGGFRTREERLAVMDARGHMPFSPPDVRVPTEVKFDHMEKSKKEKSCFVATAGGWHTGALVVDLEPEDESEEEEEEALDMPGAFPTTEALPPAEPAAHAIPLIRIRGGMMPFRIGFAGRGLARGHAGLGGAIGRGGPNAGRGGAPQ